MTLGHNFNSLNLNFLNFRMVLIDCLYEKTSSKMPGTTVLLRNGSSCEAPVYHLYSMWMFMQLMVSVLPLFQVLSPDNLPGLLQQTEKRALTSVTQTYHAESREKHYSKC